MESFNNLQEDIRSKLQKIISNFKKSPKERLTIPYIETRLESLEQQWTLFNNTHTQIVSQVKRTELQGSDYYKKGVYDEVEDLYIEFKTNLKALLMKVNPAESVTRQGFSTTDDGSRSRVKLPEIKIPMFSGKYIEWQTFRDLFVGLVHENRSLDDAQKFYYLRGHLTGEAEQLLRNFQVSSDSYKVAWDKLNKTYNNKRFLANGILKRLLNQRTLVSESAVEIKRLISITSDCLESIKNLGIDVSTWDILIIHIISAKLDKDTRKAWEFTVSSESTEELPTFSQFAEFLGSRFRGLENLEFREKPALDKRPKSFHIVKEKKNDLQSCAYCAGDHKITACKAFSRETNENRRNIVMEKRLCFICLNGNHSARYCKNTNRCQVCKRRHHSLLHPSGVSGPLEDEERTAQDKFSIGEQVSSRERKVTAEAEGSSRPMVSCFTTGNNKTVLLATAVVQARSRDGTYKPIRALLDQGSQGSFINESIVNYLGLKKVSSLNTLTGVGGDNKVTSRSTVTIKIKSRIDPQLEFQINAYVLKSVTSILPATKVTRIEWVNVEVDNLADPEYDRPNKIDILLGAEIYSQIVQEGVKRNSSGSLLAQKTALGWVLSGVCEVDNAPNKVHSHITVTHCCLEADEMLKRFWELEAEPPRTKRILTDEELECERLFSETTKRDENGRYVVRLPFRDADPACQYGGSRNIAIKRFHALESKLNRNNDLKEKYSAVMDEYLELGHMRPISEGDNSKRSTVYLPHHAVVRNDKETTKVRVVYDASCKGSNEISLNDDLLIGPQLQPDLRHLLIRWRAHPICLIADVIKMYRQVRVAEKHTDFQRIVWRNDKNAELKDYKLLTVTFGTAAAPFLAVRSMQQLAYDEGESYQLAAKRVLSDYYMDDLLTGCQTLAEGIEIYRQMNTLLSKAGFELQKWSSNSNELLDNILCSENESKDSQGKEFRIKQDEVLKTLGLTWNRSSDTFRYSVQHSSLQETVTKRKVLSDIAKLFDPLGWVAPVVIVAKALIQKLWIIGIGWDDPLPDEMKTEWFTYRKDLKCLEEFSIPRWLGMKVGDKQIDLHGFCDASKTAYAAVVYVRVVDAEDNVHVTLLTAKTKVAPIKTVSIPRLELCGAVLLAKLLGELFEVMEIPKSNLHAWTDSEIVLAWLNSHPSRWKPFVANRVSEILCLSEPRQWNHVSSKQNPADCASRGLYPSELLNCRLWLEGPEFLKEKVIPLGKWKHVSTNVEEIKVHVATKAVDVDNSIWGKYSSLTKLIRIVAYCRRVLEWRKPKDKRNKSYLKASEMKLALEVCIRQCQQRNFGDEMLDLQGKRCKKSNIFRSLDPYLDSSKILRVGGRLELSDMSSDRKHPVLIPHKSPFTNLLIADAHRLTLHGGPRLMLNYLCTKYYILGAKKLVRAYVRRCVTCLRYAASTKPQLMGQLPSSRVTPSRPFSNSGVDYAGPISLRTSKGRGYHAYKGYVCLFVCMATKAIHLEVVSDLTTEGFLAAFKRFVARRGHCKNIWSDNGTNFQGASKELHTLVQSERSGIAQEIAEAVANQGTTWHFIPPHAPNFGGLWEAGVKSCKQHLRKVIGSSTLTYEEMATLLSQIEACLNSRPLCRVTDSVDALTPGHFLVGEPLINVADHNFESANISSLKRWHLVQRMLQDFWRRWSNEYLTTLLQRYKWCKQTPEPGVGDIVLVKEDNLPPCRWLLGRVVEKHPGPDKLTRVVTLRTSRSVIKRPTSRLCILPIG